MDTRQRYHGAMLGLAAGDALGATLEFRRAGSFEPITDMIGGGAFDLEPGQWTDDTSMALCLADSLVRRRGFDPVDQLQRYVQWYRQGLFSSTDAAFDIGNTIRSALERFEETHRGDCGSTDPLAAGNGSLMRLAPVPLFFAGDPQEAVQLSGESSRTTHACPAAVDACRYLGALIVGALAGATKDELLAQRYSPAGRLWESQPLSAEIDEVAAGSFKRRHPPEIVASSYVVRTLEAALWAFYHSESFGYGALKAVNLGDDADTVGAVFGQLAGAFYGEEDIPANWRAILARREMLESYADSLYELRS